MTLAAVEPSQGVREALVGQGGDLRLARLIEEFLYFGLPNAELAEPELDAFHRECEEHE